MYFFNSLFLFFWVNIDYVQKKIEYRRELVI